MMERTKNHPTAAATAAAAAVSIHQPEVFVLNVVAAKDDGDDGDDGNDGNDDEASVAGPTSSKIMSTSGMIVLSVTCFSVVM
mmetsp:Transcript_24833/g.58945  ORF Transcript_24833/g.58945 Transcript_24833/m.58945 type:complete len:82 (+) Transcript_24833:2523-2768(+)|eukprot:CAMPEP_0113470480 /NCGR_PEP_ID=MMETSP0014_2-20120614/16464_1 /TAXON_ID=2857 /ORGANISM="Nitzschia sp." /LENGTH=81 /DNA_ID=CAMNT_0000363045 /DNA_START=2500 /DNA_END=2745 /DNA_ORIENTATION=- /assembly_acc=CAM_ASM_000159